MLVRGTVPKNKTIATRNRFVYAGWLSFFVQSLEGLGKRRTLGITAVIATMIALGSPHAEAGPVFTFGANETTTFSLTNSGVTATFSSPTASTQFMTTTGSAGFTGYMLYDSGVAPNANIPLDIALSTTISSLSFYYMTDGSGTITMEAYNGGSLVESVTNSGAIPAGQTYPQGFISLSGARFDSVVVTSTAIAFALVNGDTSPGVGPSVPEPATLGLLAFGVIGLVAARRRSATMASSAGGIGAGSGAI